MPMMASCGIRARRTRIVEKTAAPMKVKNRLIQYTLAPCGSPPVKGSRMAMVAPSAAIWASDRSTKITPRSTTWTPRYEWIPVRIRLAAKGAARNFRILRSMSLLCSGGLDRVHEELDVVIEELEVVGDLLLASDGGRHDQHFRSGLSRDRVRCLQVEVGLDHDDLHVLALHLLDHVDRVRRRGRDPRPRLDVADDVEAEPLGEVGPRAVVGDDLEAAVRGHRRLPALFGLGEAPREVPLALSVVGVVG